MGQTPYAVLPNHYSRESQALGAFAYNEAGQATVVGSQFTQPLNGPPASVYLPIPAGRTSGTNGRTTAPPGHPIFGQTRTAEQKPSWTATGHIDGF
jgi:hypothetical protein